MISIAERERLFEIERKRHEEEITKRERLLQEERKKHEQEEL
jgi:hypothetical protein